MSKRKAHHSKPSATFTTWLAINLNFKMFHHNRRAAAACMKCRSALCVQYVAVCYNVLQFVAAYFWEISPGELQHGNVAAPHTRSVLQCVALCCTVLQCATECCSWHFRYFSRRAAAACMKCRSGSYVRKTSQLNCRGQKQRGAHTHTHIYVCAMTR